VKREDCNKTKSAGVGRGRTSIGRSVRGGSRKNLTISRGVKRGCEKKEENVWSGNRWKEIRRRFDLEKGRRNKGEIAPSGSEVEGLVERKKTGSVWDREGIVRSKEVDKGNVGARKIKLEQRRRGYEKKGPELVNRKKKLDEAGLVRTDEIRGGATRRVNVNFYCEKLWGQGQRDLRWCPVKRAHHKKKEKGEGKYCHLLRSK